MQISCLGTVYCAPQIIIFSVADHRHVLGLWYAGIVAPQSAASILDRRAKTHGTLNILGWAVLLPIGAMVARYARGFDPAWFYAHVGIQIVGFACIIAGVATGVQLTKEIQLVDLDAHRGLGIFLLVLAILQVFFEYFLNCSLSGRSSIRSDQLWQRHEKQRTFSILVLQKHMETNFKTTEPKMIELCITWAKTGQRRGRMVKLEFLQVPCLLYISLLKL